MHSIDGIKYLAVGIVLMIGTTSARSAPLPFESTAQHMGVASCSGGGNCHGAERPQVGSSIRQNEYFVWQSRDLHARAYKALQSPRGKAIALNLGFKSATEAPECLTCHSDYVPTNVRGRKFSLAEGVGCEACHGGAQKWYADHVQGVSHQQNLDAGLYPLEDPEARARLCLQCHLGTDDKPINHRLMGAGHPALEFELDTFTDNEWAHFGVDSDYRKRKKYRSGAQTWATGQLVAADLFLEGLVSQRFDARGLFPELIFFDCNACHHPVQSIRWNPGVAGSLGPGSPRLADASLVTSGILLSVISPGAGKEWNETLAKLHSASNQTPAKTKEVASQLRALSKSALDQLRNHAFSRAEALSIIDRLAAAGLDRHAGSYTAGKQIYFGISSLDYYLQREHGLSESVFKKAVSASEAAVAAPTTYNPEVLRDALKAVREAAATTAAPAP